MFAVDMMWSAEHTNLPETDCFLWAGTHMCVESKALA